MDVCVCVCALRYYSVLFKRMNDMYVRDSFYVREVRQIIVL